MLLLLITLLGSSYLFHLLYWKRRNLPPGPVPLPLIGNLYLMKKEVKPGYKLWKGLTNQFGPVFTFWMANFPIVMVTDYQLIKQSFIKDGSSYVGRPEIPLSIKLRKGCYGITEAHGDRWVQQRRFVLHVFRDFGMGKNLMEEKVIDEFRSLVDTVKKEQRKNGKVDMQHIIDAAVGSIINNLLFGYRYDETNMSEFLMLKEKSDKFMKLAGEPMGVVIYLYPWAGKLPIINKSMEDYVEAFLKERKKHENEPNYGGFEMEQLESVCFDLWIAGMETTSNTLYWALLYVVVNDDVRQKVYEELDTKIGNDRIITSSDKSELNYINATINEVQRMANLVPVNVNHVTTKDVEIGGHTIPKDTVINPMISQVLYDEKIFPEPETFKPERFLDSEGNLLKIEELVPFSIGKRQCLGEGLARLELFIFFANIFNQFDITLDRSNPKPSLEKEYGATMKANNFNIVMKKRY